MAGMKGLSDDDTARWIFEDSEVEGEFNDEEESDDNTQPVTSSWKVYRDGDCDLIEFLYSVTQQGFTLP
jgi:hypothetical protein